MSALTDRITAVLQEEFMAGCTAIYDPRTARRIAQRIEAEVQADIDLLRWLLAESLWHEQIRRDQVQALRRALPVSIPEPNPYMSANYGNAAAEGTQ